MRSVAHRTAEERGVKLIKIKNLKTSKPINAYDVRVDRQSVLGNPFYMSDESKRKEVCEKYSKWFKKQIRERNTELIDELNRIDNLFEKHGELNLYCWCAPKQCHAETIKDAILWKRGLI